MNPLVKEINTHIGRCVEGGIAESYGAQPKNEARLRNRTKYDENGSGMYFVFTISYKGPPTVCLVLNMCAGP